MSRMCIPSLTVESKMLKSSQRTFRLLSNSGAIFSYVSRLRRKIVWAISSVIKQQAQDYIPIIAEYDRSIKQKELRGYSFLRPSRVGKNYNVTPACGDLELACLLYRRAL